MARLAALAALAALPLASAGEGCPCAEASLCAPLTTPAAEREIFAFVTGESWRHFLAFQPRATTIAVFGAAEASAELVCSAHGRGTRVVTGEDFDKSKLGDAAARSAWVAGLVSKMRRLGLDGFNLDIEGSTANREGLTSLVRELAAEVRKVNPLAQLSFDLSILPKGQTQGYAHKDLAAELDFLVPMAYDECWGASRAAANSPFANLAAGVQQYKDLGIESSQLVLGLPWYGWDFPCDSAGAWEQCSITVPAGKQWYGYATQISYQSANATAAEHAVKYDDVSMTAYTEYTDSAGQRHQRWFDNPRTLAAKYAEAGRLGARGVAFWTADQPDYGASQGQDMWAALSHFSSASSVALVV